MKDELTLEYIKEFIVPRMEVAQAEHPKANITYDTEKNRINISYPLPADFRRIQEIRFAKTPKDLNDL